MFYAIGQEMKLFAAFLLTYFRVTLGQVPGTPGVVGDPGASGAAGPVGAPGCSTTFIGSGAVKSPGYPAVYGNNLVCSFVLKANAGSLVKLRFVAFDLEGPDFDTLQVYGGAVLYATYSGNTLPSVLTLPSPATLVFRSDASVQNSGFSIEFTSEATCGGRLTGAGVLESPNYPSNYANNQRCTWSLTALPGTTIVLQFSAFNTEGYYDPVEFYSGSMLVARYSGGSVPPTINLGISGKVVFRTDGSVVATGFRMIFTSIALPCGGLVVNGILSNSIIKTPNYPNPYPDNALCTWTLVASYPATSLRLIFNAFTLEDVQYDSVQVYAGQTLVGTYGGSTIPNLPTLGPTATLVFSSDYSTTFSGFYATLSAQAVGPEGQAGPPGKAGAAGVQ